MGIAGEAIRDKRYAEATEFLNKAIDLAKNSFRPPQVATKHSSRSLRYSAIVAASYLLREPRSSLRIPRKVACCSHLAELSAGNASRYYPDDKIKQRCYYYLVINKLRHAASVDPSVSAQANRAIANYSRYLPSAQEIFMHPDIKKGSTVSFGGESVVIP